MDPNLQKSSVFCKNLWFSAVSCALEMLEFPGERKNLSKSAVFCENLRFGLALIMRTVLGESDFYWPLMVLAEQWQCSLYANVLPVQSSVSAMFLRFLANGRVPPFPILEGFLEGSVS